MLQINNHEDASLERYLLEIGREEQLTEEEEKALAIKAREGSRRAQDRLVTANLKLVVSIAKKFQGKGLRLPDLINEGNLGLLRASEKYDGTRGIRFASFATMWIRQAIEEALAEQARVVTMPSDDLSRINKLNGLRSAFEQEHGMKPNINEIAEAAKMSEIEVKNAMKGSSRQFSVDAPIREGAPNTLLDILAADMPATDTQTAAVAARAEIARVVSLLDDRERNVVTAFYGIGEPEQTFAEIGKRYGYSRERARQIRKKALRHMRSKTKNRFLRTYLSE